MASIKDIRPFAPGIPPSSVNPGVRPPGQFFLPVELKNEILRNMKYIGPQIFSWGDDHRQIIDLSTAGEVKIHMVDNTIITLERLNPNPQHNEFMMVAEWCQWAMERDGLQENLPASRIENRAEALRRMKECLITRRSMLNLSNLGLTSLPENLPPHLIEFYCSKNVLTALPKVMPKWLLVLDCTDNVLILLPKVQPSKLMVLNCYDNCIIWLPELSTNLRVINCSENFLQFLPPSMPQYLYKLSCAGNNINSIPDEMLENLTRLKVFDCSSNDLISAPRLPPKLIIYYCGENQFKTVPVPQPRSLKVFSCNGNPWDKDNLPTLLKAVEGLKNQEGLEELLDFLHKECQMKLEKLEKLEDLDDLMVLELLDDPVLLERVKVQEDLELLDQQLGLLSLERQQDSQPVNQHSEHEPESASRVKRDLSEVEFESTMKRKRFM